MHIIQKSIYILVTLAIIIKIVFLLTSVLYYISKLINTKVKNKIFKYKHNFEFIYNIIVALLIIIIFNPWYNNMRFISKEIKTLFFIFGVIIIITLDWNKFIIK